MGAAAYTHLITKVCSTNRGSIWFDSIPQTYKTIMGTVGAASTLASGDGNANMDMIINPAGPTYSSYSSPAQGWNKGFMVAGSSTSAIYNHYDSTSGMVGQFGSSSYFTYYDDQVNTCVFYCYDYADANTVTSIAFQAGSPFFGTGTTSASRPEISIGVGGMVGANAMTSLSVGPNGNFMSGCLISLYGIN